MFLSSSCKTSELWAVFGSINRCEKVEIPKEYVIPETVTVGERQIQVRKLIAVENKVDLAPFIGGCGDGKGALVLIPLTVDDDGVYSVGLGADWWFEAYIDGNALLSSPRTGNEIWPPSICDFRADLELKKGEHLLAIRFTSGTGGATLCVAVGTAAELTEYVAEQRHIKREEISSTVDFSVNMGKINPLHGVNNGPVTYNSLIDVSDNYRELGVPWVRLHDSNYPHPREVDIPQIFPNEDADPTDPSNYDFRRTDTYIKNIIDTGAKIVYRLGVSIEHAAIKYYTHPPKDFKRWAQVCVGIIKHYNHGWANGFHYNITHWEIWNEPEGDSMWTGTQEQYFELYREASLAIKEFDPTVKVGGFAVTTPKVPMVKDFLAYCRDKSLPLDFFSWHCYGKNPKKMVDCAGLVQELLAQYGYSAVESHMNEWNLWPGWHFGKGQAGLRKECFERLKNEIGASFCVSVLIRLQDKDIDVANYYDGQPRCTNFCGLFDFYGVPQKTYYGFLAFSRLTAYPERVAAIGKDGVDILAAINRERKQAAVLLSKFGGESWLEQPVFFKNLPSEIDSYELVMVDRDRNLETVSRGMIGREQEVVIAFREHSVALLRLFSSENNK
ncbi:MAG: hypothetical protein JXR78_00875 [Victivallales bacterium]|nr:hypothetical protein [Victivallales bacterium]